MTIRTQLEQLPPESLVPAGWVLENLDPDPEPVPVAEPEPATWRERLWTVPAETRIGVRELAEAVDRSRDWVYRRTAKAADDRLPHRKMDGELTFVVGEIREWINGHEDVIHVPRGALQ